MEARAEATNALRAVDNYGGAIEDGRTTDPALAVLLASRAIATELRALGTVIDFARSDAR
jgi:hypothetical protein